MDNNPIGELMQKLWHRNTDRLLLIKTLPKKEMLRHKADWPGFTWVSLGLLSRRERATIMQNL